MTPAVIDTDVVSYLFKCDPRAERYLRHLKNRELLISFMTEAEIEQWPRLAGWGPKRIQLLRDYMRQFGVVYSSRELCVHWVDATVSARQAGRPIEVADAWIAATALLYGCPLVTHNRADYAGVCGLELIT
jgi:predicted nucleic acid-binding protein